MVEILFLSLFVLVPAGLLAFMRPMGRRVFGVLGLVTSLALAFVILGGPDSPLLILGGVPIGVTLGALLVELVAQARAVLRRRKRVEPS